MHTVEQLHIRADSLTSEFQKAGNGHIVNNAIGLRRQALQLCPPGHPMRSYTLSELAINLSDRYDLQGQITDLEEAITLAREACGLQSVGHQTQPTDLNILGVCLLDRYKRLGKMVDLNESILLFRTALENYRLKDVLWSAYLNNLALSLSDRYDLLGQMNDLDDAILCARESLCHLPPTSTRRSTSLTNLASHLSSRYERCGAMEDLTEAIVLNMEALRLCSDGCPLRSNALSNLAVDLATRYETLRTIEDLHTAVVLDRQALSLRSNGHPLRRGSLNNLASHLFTRHTALNEVQDLEDAMTLYQQALELFLPGDPGLSMSLNNIANTLFARYGQRGSMEDLDSAIFLDREALRLRPLGHPDRPMSLNNLAVCLSTRHRQLHKIEDLEEAITLVRYAVSLSQPGNPNRSRSLHNLARCLWRRSHHSGHVVDKEEMLVVYNQLALLDQHVCSGDISASKSWISIAEELHHPTLLAAYETALRLLRQHLTAFPSLPRHFMLFKDLTSSSFALDAFSLCLREGRDSEHAVEILERGRAMFWNQLNHLHSPMDVVRAHGPAGKLLSDKFAHLSSIIHDTMSPSTMVQHDQVFHLNMQLHHVISDIRRIPSLAHFLQPSFSDLRRAAAWGPVIIVNASKYGCDALIVFHHRDPVHLPLHTELASVQQMGRELHSLTVLGRKLDATKQLASFLRKLWNDVVSAIVDILQATCPFKSRIWWCPTGSFSTLPLHAAGPYRKGYRNLPELYVSSYTLTLSNLTRAMSRSCRPTEKKRFAAIGQGAAVDQSELPSVATELDAIEACMSGRSEFSRMDGPSLTMSHVIDGLQMNEWVHLACHGMPNSQQPFQSAFALHDGNLTIEHIVACKPNNAEFAYLSACHTTVGNVNIPDEMIHLAAAMHFVGFSSVVGTMWAVDDAHAKRIASKFYEYMVDENGHLDCTRAATALNKATTSVDVPLDQRVLYVHLGV